ncbi:MAG: hypothetical protein WDN29_16305 [Methylovirgula sp.]
MAGDVSIAFGGETGDLEAALAEAKAQVSSYSSDLRRMAQQMQQTGASADTDLAQKMRSVGSELAEAQSHAAEFRNQLRETTEGGKEAGEAFGSITELLPEIAAAMGIAFSVDAVKEWVEGMAEAGETAENVSHQLGISAAQASQLSAEATLTGTDVQGLTSDFERLQEQLATSQNSTSRSAQALRVLGINAQEFSKSSISNQIEQLSEAFSRFADGPTKTAAAVALLGRSGAQLLPFLDRGKEGFEELNAEIEKFGAGLTDAQAESFAGVADQFHQAAVAGQGLSNAIYSQVAPAMTDVLKYFLDMGTDLQEAGAHIDDVRSLLTFLADAAHVSASGFIGLGGIAVSQFVLIQAAVREAIDSIGGLAGILRDVWARNWSGVTTDARAAWASMKSDGAAFAADERAVFDNTFNHIKAQFAAIGDSGNAAFGNLSGAMAAFGKTTAPQPRVPQMQIGGDKDADQALAAQITTLNMQVNAAKGAYEQQEEMIEAQVRMKVMTAQQGAAATIAALGTELQAAGQAYSQEEVLAKSHQQKLAAIIKQAADFQTANSKEVQGAQQKAADATYDSWQKAFGDMNSSFEGQISGLLKGTTSWGQAFRNVLTQMTTDLIKFGVQQALQTTENTGLQLAGITKVNAATEEGAAQQLAAQSASAAGAIGAQIAAGAAALANDAKQVFGRCFRIPGAYYGPRCCGACLRGWRSGFGGPLRHRRIQHQP